MSDFRTKILGLAAVATAFAGVSYGQTVTCPTANIVTLGAPNPTLRAEGETELTAQVQVTGCTSNTGAGVAVTVTANLNYAVTSRLIANQTGYNSDAVVIVTDTGITNLGGTYPGLVSGNSVSFAVAQLPATFTLTTANIRINASTGLSSPQVTESLIINYPTPPTSANLVLNQPGGTPVGYIRQSLGTTTLATDSAPNTQYYNYTACAGNSFPLTGTLPTASNLSFTVNVVEVTGGAFKTAAQESGQLQTGNYADIANQPTEIQVALVNVPASATIYVPQTVTSGGTTLTLAGITNVATTPTSIASSNLVGLGVTNNSASIIYAVTTAGTTGATFPIQVYVIFAKNTASAQGPITALASYYPTGALTGPATNIPTFAPPTASPINVSLISPCQTTLLFPYVTNASGFETGIAIANTTTDNLGTAGASSATATTGTCTLNFYSGTGTQPTAYTTPMPIGVSTTATPTAGSVWTSTLSTASGATNFSGYAIALCSFLDAHGFAYIVDNFGTPSGTAEGYVALVVPTPRSNTAGDGGLGE